MNRVIVLCVALTFFTCQVTGSPVGAFEPPALSAEMTLDLQLQESFDFDRLASVIVLDLFNSAPPVVHFLLAKGTVPLCQIEVASLASFRPDAEAVAPTLIGKAAREDPRHSWLDIRRRSTLMPWIRGRLKLCKSKGFLGALLVNLDAYQVKTGFPIERSHMENYLRFLSYEARRLQLILGLYQEGDLALPLHPYFDFAVADRCHETEQCGLFLPFIKAGKPVFSIHRSNKRLDQEAFCKEMDKKGFSGLIKPTKGSFATVQCRDLLKIPIDATSAKKQKKDFQDTAF